MRLSASAIFAGALSAATLLAMGVGLWLIGSPSHIRDLRLDEQRVNDLQALVGTIAGYKRTHHRLPQSFDELHEAGVWPTWRSLGIESYQYHPIDASKYELCANFQTDSTDEAASASQRKDWSHKAGLVCFMRDAGPQ